LEAEKWLRSCWFAAAGLRLTFWGEQWMGVLGGILLKKPMYYDNYATGVLYREFHRLEEVERTAVVLDRIKAVDRLFAIMTIRLRPLSEYSFLTWKNLILTLWARHRLDGESEALSPLALAPFRRFFNELLPGPPPPGGSEPRRIPDAMKADFVQWLAQETRLAEAEISDKLGGVFEELFAEVESEVGRVRAEDLDPRFVQLFLLNR